MPLPRILPPVVLSLALCACGDSREDFAGTYTFSGTFSVDTGGGISEQRESGEFDVVADASDGDRLFTSLACGLYGELKDESDTTAMVFIPKDCPTQTEDDCSFTLQYTSGAGRIESDLLKIGLHASILVRCNGRPAQHFPVQYDVLGRRKEATTAEPGQAARPREDSALGEPVLRSLLQAYRERTHTR